MPTRTPPLRHPRRWTIAPALVAVSAFALGYLIWLIVGLSSGTACGDVTLACGPTAWSVVIGVLYAVAAVAGTVAFVAMLVLVVRSMAEAFAHLRD